MSFLKKLFGSDEESKKLIGGILAKDLDRIKKTVQPSKDFTKSCKIWSDYKCNRQNVLELLNQGIDVKHVKDNKIPVLFLAEDQDTYDIFLYFDAEPNINSYDVERLDFYKFSPFILDKYWDTFNKMIIEPTYLNVSIASLERIDVVDFLIEKKLDIDKLIEKKTFRNYGHIFYTISQAITFSSYENQAETFIKKVKPDFEKFVEANSCDFSYQIPVRLFYFKDLLNTMAYFSFKPDYLDRYERIFGKIDYQEKSSSGENLAFLIPMISEPHHQNQVLKFLINNGVNPMEENNHGVSYYKWILQNPKGKKVQISEMDKFAKKVENQNQIDSLSNSKAMSIKGFSSDIMQNNLPYDIEKLILEEVFVNLDNASSTEILAYDFVLRSSEMEHSFEIFLCIPDKSDSNIEIKRIGKTNVRKSEVETTIDGPGGSGKVVSTSDTGLEISFECTIEIDESMKPVEFNIYHSILPNYNVDDDAEPKIEMKILNNFSVNGDKIIRVLVSISYSKKMVSKYGKDFSSATEGAFVDSYNSCGHLKRVDMMVVTFTTAKKGIGLVENLKKDYIDKLSFQYQFEYDFSKYLLRIDNASYRDKVLHVLKYAVLSNNKELFDLVRMNLDDDKYVNECLVRAIKPLVILDNPTIDPFRIIKYADTMRKPIEIPKGTTQKVNQKMKKLKIIPSKTLTLKQTEIVNAILQNSDEREALKLIDIGYPINFSISNNLNLLHLACLSDKLNVAKALIDVGIDINSQTTSNPVGDTNQMQSNNIGGFSPLHIACQNGNQQIVKLLIDLGADVNLVTQQELTPLMKASEKNHTEIVKMLIEQGANINQTNASIESALILASQKNSGDAATRLIEAGANVNGEDKNHRPAIAYFIIKGNISLVDLLIKNGANFDYEKKLKNLAFYSAIIDSIQSKNYSKELVKLLKDNGYDLNTYLDGHHAIYIMNESEYPMSELEYYAELSGMSKEDIKLHMSRNDLNDIEKFTKLIIKDNHQATKDYLLKNGININSHKAFNGSINWFLDQYRADEYNDEKTIIEIEKLLKFYKSINSYLDYKNDLQLTSLLYILMLLLFEEKSFGEVNKIYLKIIDKLLAFGCNVNCVVSSQTALDIVEAIQDKKTKKYLIDLFSKYGGVKFDDLSGQWAETINFLMNFDN
jgi:ankyrin repeat protein